MNTPQTSAAPKSFTATQSATGAAPVLQTVGTNMSSNKGVSTGAVLGQQFLCPAFYVGLIATGFLVASQTYEAASVVGVFVLGRFLFGAIRALRSERAFYAETAEPSLFKQAQKVSRWAALGYTLAAMLIAFGAVLQGLPMAEVLDVLVVLAAVAAPVGLASAVAQSGLGVLKRLTGQGVLVRRPEVLGQLAQSTLVFTDKTGFLTLNNQTAQVVWIPASKKHKTKNKDGEHVLLKGVSFEGSKRRLMRRLAMVGVLCNEAEIKNGRPTGEGLDTALMRFGTRMMLNQKQLLRHFPKVGQLPFSSTRQYAATFHTHGKHTLAAVKGAPEAVAYLCGSTDAKPAPWLEEVKNLADGGYEVLAFAGGPVKGTALEDLQKLTFLGLVAFVDPARGDVSNAVGQCRVAGVDVKMITGDHPYTALNVAKDLGIAARMDEVVTGPDLFEMNPKGDKFAACVAQAKVFARISPMQKEQIIAAAVAAGERVVVTGSKHDDLPALKAAHVSVATGQKGADVARHMADVVLANDTFAALANGLIQARGFLANSRKAAVVMMGMSFTLFTLFAANAAMGTALPLTVTQLVWLQLMLLGFGFKLFASEPTEHAHARKHPQALGRKVMSRAVWAQAAFNGVFVGGVTAYSFMFSQTVLNYTVSQACAAALLILVLAQAAMALTSRTRFSLGFGKGLFTNKTLLFAAFGGIALHVGAMFASSLYAPVKAVLELHAPTLMIWQHMAVYVVIAICFMEAAKMVARKV